MASFSCRTQLVNEELDCVQGRLAPVLENWREWEKLLLPVREVPRSVKTWPQKMGDALQEAGL